MTNILIIIIIGLIPILFYCYRINKYHNIKKSIIISIIYSLFISIILSFFIKFNIYELTIGTLINIYLITSFLSNNINIKKVPKTILVIGLFFMISLIQLIPMSLLHLDIENITLKQQTYLTFFSDISLLILLLIIYFKDLKKEFINFKNNFYSMFETSFKIWFIGLILMVTSNLLIQIFVKQAVAGNENSVQSMIDVLPVISFICAGLIAPITEELTFRKSFKDIFKNKWAFILTSGIVFGTLHVAFSFTSIYDFAYIFPYSFLGIAFAYIYYKTENIFPSIMMHMIHNSTIILLSILTGMIIL